MPELLFDGKETLAALHALADPDGVNGRFDLTPDTGCIYPNHPALETPAMGTTWAQTAHTAWANHGYDLSQHSNQAPLKGCLTCAFVWSGRRDSNPRPSPWQREDDRPASP